jgi:hypothetical protein
LKFVKKNPSSGYQGKKPMLVILENEMPAGFLCFASVPPNTLGIWAVVFKI